MSVKSLRLSAVKFASAHLLFVRGCELLRLCDDAVCSRLILWLRIGHAEIHKVLAAQYHPVLIALDSDIFSPREQNLFASDSSRK